MGIYKLSLLSLTVLFSGIFVCVLSQNSDTESLKEKKEYR